MQTKLFKLFSTFYFLSSALISFGQKEFTKWYFANKAAIDFSSGSAVVLNNSKANGTDNTCSIADSAGNLLYYFDGLNIYNKNHQVMSNGTGIASDASSGHVAVTIRRPGTGKIYYLFTVEGYAKPQGLKYSIIDMSKNGGLGAVTIKNSTIRTPTTEKIILAKNSNKKDIWLITHKYDSDEWECYPITKNGIGIAVITAIGSKLDNSSTENSMGNIDINLGYNKIASALYNQGKVEIFDFNSSSGKLSNGISMSGLTRAWGVQFSPNGSKLYLTQWTTDKLWQYDLSSYNKTDIENSKISLGPVTGPDGGYKAGYLMLAPDKKIYIGKYLSSYLGVINNPDASGSSCNFVDDGIKITPGQSSVGLPNKTFDVIRCYIHKPYLGRDTSICKGEQLILKDTVKNVSSYLWSDFSNKSTLTVSKAGQYWVEISNGDCQDRDTINVSFKKSPLVKLGKDTVLCDFSNYTLGAKLGGPTYLWSTAETTKTIKPRKIGSYWVQVDSNGCKAADTIVLTLNNSPKPSLGKDTSACEGAIITLTGFTTGAKNYTWSTGNQLPNQDVNVSGTYILKISDNVCTLADTVKVTFIPYPKVYLGRDTGFCGNFTLKLDAGNTGLSKIWSTFETSQTITLNNQFGPISVTVSNQGCKKSDEIVINKLPGPSVDLGPDSIYCSLPIAKVFNAQNPGMNYLWDNGSTAQTYSINGPGKYWLRVSDATGCVYSDTIALKDLSFSFAFGEDISICFGKSIVLKGLKKPYTNSWSGSGTSDSLIVNSSGLYKVTVSNGACKQTDSIKVNIWPQIHLDLGPDTFLCDALQETITLSGPPGFTSYSWQPGGATESSLDIKLPGVYSLKVTDANDCDVKDEIEVKVLCPISLWVPTAFNPGSGGVNGRFGVSYMGPPVEGFEMIIFNRWGELIYKSNDINGYWDGTYLGNPCQLGMYMCIINFKSLFVSEKKRNTYQGMFYLNR